MSGPSRAETEAGSPGDFRGRSAYRYRGGRAGRRQAGGPVPLLRYLSGNFGAAGQNAPAALHQGGAGGPGAVSNGLLQGGGLRRRPHCRAPLYPGAAGAGAESRCKGLLRYTPCRPWNLPPCEGGGDHRPRDALRVLPDQRRDRRYHKRDQAGRGTGHLCGHHLLPHGGELRGGGRHYVGALRVDQHLYLSGV